MRLLSQNPVRPRTVFIALLAALLVAPLAVAGTASAQLANPNAPIRSAERSHGQAALPAQPNESLSAKPGQVKKEEAEEFNVYRHTRLVQKLADTFHLDVETMARIFEWINTGIILLVIILPIAKFLPRAIYKRKQTLKHRLETARQTTADANSRLSAVEAQLARLDDEIAKIRAQVEDESKQDEARIKASLKEESERIFTAAENEIAAAAAHARRELRHFAADLAIENAARQLTLTPEADRALIDEFVAEATNGLAKGARS